jgi:hypothetical protein
LCYGKKLFFLAVTLISLASRKKDYSCNCYAGAALETTLNYLGLSKSEAKTGETACALHAACTWVAK